MQRKLIIIFYIILFICALILGTAAWRATQRASVLIAWSTATETDTAGYNLYRLDDPAGTEILVNSELIPAEGGPFSGSEYSYQDADLQPGKSYTYVLEEIENNGSLNRDGEIVITARRGGLTEILLAGVLGIVSIVGLVWVLRN